MLPASPISGGLLEAWVHAPWGSDDLAAWERLLAVLPVRSPARPPVQSRIDQLTAGFAVATPVQPSRFADYADAAGDQQTRNRLVSYSPKASVFF